MLSRPHIVGLSVTLISFILLNLLAKGEEPPKVQLQRQYKEDGKLCLIFSAGGARRPHILWRFAKAGEKSPWQKVKPLGRYEAPSKDHHILQFEIETVGEQEVQAKFVENRRVGKRFESELIILGRGPQPFWHYIEKRLYGQPLPFDPVDAMREIHLRSPKGFNKGRLKEFTAYLKKWNKAVNDLNQDGKLAFFHDLPHLDESKELPHNTGVKFFDYLKKARQRFLERVKFPFHRSENHHQVLPLPLRPRLLIEVCWLLFGREDMVKFLKQGELRMLAGSGWRRRPWSRAKNRGQFRKRALLPLLRRAVPQDLGANARLRL